MLGQSVLPESCMLLFAAVQSSVFLQRSCSCSVDGSPGRSHPPPSLLNAEVKGWLCGECGKQAAFPSHLALTQGVHQTGLCAAAAVICRALPWFSVGQSGSLL